MNDTSKLNRERKRFPLSKATVMVMGALGMFSHGQSFAAEESADASEETEVISVTGMRSSIISAQEVKMNSNKIMDAISSDDIGALPDRSVTETLQRIPGIQIDRYMSQGDPEHFSVEGNGVAVRGLTQVASLLNGRNSFSADGGRTLSFGDVPPELLDAVHVFKSPTADQIEGGLSGSVDLITKLPFHKDGQQVAFSIAANYGDTMKEVDPEYSFMYSNTWNTDFGKFGLLADIANSELSTRNDSMYVRPFFSKNNMPGKEGTSVYVPRGADWRTMHFNRERSGKYLALQWAPTDNQELAITYFSSDYDMRWDEDAIFVSNDITEVVASADSVYTDANVFAKGRLSAVAADGTPSSIQMGSDVRISTQNAKTEDISLEYKWHNDNTEVSFAVQRLDATSKGIDSTVAVAVWLPWIDVDLTGALPTVTSDPVTMGDPNSYVWDFLMDNQYDNSADMTSFQADVKYYLTDAGPIKSIKTGVRFSKSESSNFDSGYNWGAVGNWLYNSGLIESGANPTADDMHLNKFENFFGGDVPQPAALYAPKAYFAEGFPESYQEVKDKVTYVDNGWFDPVANTWQPRNLMDDQWYNSQEEKTSAAYVQLDFEFDSAMPVSGNLGGRYVKTENTAFGYLTFPTRDEFNNGAIEMPAEHDYSNFLPSLNVKVDLTDDLVLRFAAARAMARPNFSDLKSRMQLNVAIKQSSQNKFNDDGTLKDGETFSLNDFDFTAESSTNPYMDPMTSDQLDLSLEWYYGEGDSMSFALFTKDIEGYQVTSFLTETYDGVDYRVQRPVSEGEAKLNGAEISVNHWFKDLPAPLDGFGISANYTYIDSETDVNDDAAPVDTDGSTYDAMPYRNISKNAYNITAMYEKGPLSIRLAYNWRGKYLTSVGANGFNGSIDLDENGNVVPWNDNADVQWRLPVYNAATGYLDGSISYKINDNLTVALEANNLNDAVTRNIIQHNGAGNQHSAYHVNDIRYALSLRGNF
ncbi:TonB-dependent receptor [Catenovulum agarivorans]|uniref:TonB-dependent receptor n=1 Tax=Catenovulum agarivorans TaxID=1172192 RepID=UPI00030609FB|nr:TonB-dependent receptor [Catenovulum agarivorans]